MCGSTNTRLYIDTSSDVGLYTLPFTVIFAWPGGVLRPLGSAAVNVAFRGATTCK